MVHFGCMALNIKNQRVVELAKQCAQLTGQTQVTVVEAAQEAYLASVIAEEPTHRARGEQLVREVQAEAQTAGILSTDELYDKGGLPARSLIRPQLWPWSTLNRDGRRLFTR